MHTYIHTLLQEDRNSPQCNTERIKSQKQVVLRTFIHMTKLHYRHANIFIHTYINENNIHIHIHIYGHLYERCKAVGHGPLHALRWRGQGFDQRLYDRHNLRVFFVQMLEEVHMDIHYITLHTYIHSG